MFENIYELDQRILDIVENSPEFIIKRTEHYSVVNYVCQYKETFDIEDKDFNLKRELRGITFDSDGLILARKLHKFFNIGEKECYLLENIDFSQPYKVLVKEDGSMVTPVVIDGNLEWHFKMGYNTEFSPMVEKFTEDKPNYVDFCLGLISRDFTPIFEFCSNKNRIVINQEKDRLVLIAVRDNETGEYKNLSDLEEGFLVEIVKEYSSEKDIKSLIEKLKDEKGIEGVVIRFNSGEMFKIKTDEYIRLHKIHDIMSSKKDVYAVILNNEQDDLIPKMPKDQLEILRENEAEIQKIIAKIKSVVSMYTKGNRKELALMIQKDGNAQFMSFIMNTFFRDGYNIDKAINEHILKQCSTQTRLSEFLIILN